jgi:alkanesulfonate monooxygenase SsuD/methylene tetrahydromethanopterin reductase-like flavin-dependent oxidoreductase (luciferase family)
MIELAGEVADGAFLMVGLHPAGVRAARRHLEAGANRVGRRPYRRCFLPADRVRVSFLLIFLPQLVPARGRWFVVCLLRGS